MSETGLRLIVGLGNPGPDYQDTRHNAGFWFVDRIAGDFHDPFRTEAKFHGQLARVTLQGRDLRLLKPMTFMNHSGRSVAAVARYFDITPEQILIAYDELDLAPGVVRLKKGGGHAGHNGMRDSIAALGEAGFWRLRIGIGHPGDKSRVLSHVLGRPSAEDRVAIEDGLRAAEQQLGLMLEGGFSQVMNALHSPR